MSSNSPSPKSTDAEHGSQAAKDSPEKDPSTQTPPEVSKTSESTSGDPRSPKQRVSVDIDENREQDHHPAHRYAESRDAHEEFRAVGRPTKLTRRESELAHIAAAQREIEKAEAQLGEIEGPEDEEERGYGGKYQMKGEENEGDDEGRGGGKF